MTKELFHDQSPQKYGTGPGSNSGPLDLQSDVRHVTDCATRPSSKYIVIYESLHSLNELSEMGVACCSILQARINRLSIHALSINSHEQSQ